MRKKLRNINYVRQFVSLFKCPICSSSMDVVESKSVICLNNHTFDFSKQGYINLLSRSVQTKYTKELFVARRKLFVDSHFFEPLNEQIAEVIHQHTDTKENSLFFLDMGCGEGSHLSNICELVRSHKNTAVVGVGVDIAKEGVMEAAKYYIEHIWCVADLAHAPFKESRFDVILNILSPSNYGEFSRLLSADGLVVKVVPQSNYLKELREALFEDTAKQTYSNAETVERFNHNFQLVDRTRLSYTVNLDKPLIPALIQMTPLVWTAPEERIKAFLQRDVAQVTVDFDILIGISQTKR